MWDELRSKAYQQLRGQTGNKFMPVRFVRGTMTIVNDLLGRPLAPREELEERRAYEKSRQERIAAHEAKLAAVAATPAKVAAPAQETAPVIVYTDAQSHRDLKRIADVFKGRGIPFTELSIVEDLATRSWVETQAKTKEFPVVFVGGVPVGGFDALVQLDVKGELVRLVFPN